MEKWKKTDRPATVRIDKLSGTLRQRPLSGSADLTFASPLAVNGTLDLKSGNSSISVKGKAADQTDITAELAIANLNDWVPQTNGSLRGSIAAKGKWPDLDAKANLTGTKIVSGDLHIENLAVVADVKDIKSPSGSIDIAAQKLSGGNYTFDTVKLDAHGDRVESLRRRSMRRARNSPPRSPSPAHSRIRRRTKPAGKAR